jgi:DNA-directed DNA polymerase III PolC
MKFDLPRSIVHLDADAFFASVEQSADARLRGKPVAVGGEKRGIIASASYEARKFGIYTPMPTVQARRLCPKLILIPGDFEKYELFSRLMFSYAYDFTPDVEIGSIDEGYLDVTGARKSALNIAETIQGAIRQSLKISVSEGVGSNKLISQVASKLRKPDALQFVAAGHEAGFLSPLPNQWLPGIGPKTANHLNAAGLARIGQVAATPAALLSLLVGQMASQLRNFAQGIDDRPVVTAREPAKSYGEQQTFDADTTDHEFLVAVLRRMADQLMAKVRADELSVRTLTVKIRYNDMQDEQVAESLAEPTDVETDIYGKLPRLLDKAWTRRVSLRLVSLKLSNLYDRRFSNALEMDSSARQQRSQQLAAGVVDELRLKFGRRAILRGHDFLLRRREAPRKKSPMPPQSQRDCAPKPRVASAFARLPWEKKPQSPNPERVVPTPSPNALELKETGASTPAADYHSAMVQRQRLGHYALRQPPEGKTRHIAHNSPSPEFRLRTRADGNQPKIVSFGPRAAPFVPLHVHSYYSFLDSTLSIKSIIETAWAREWPAVALTDTNNLHGAVEFTQAALTAGIKPIIGAQVEWRGHRACLYVETQTGYVNLCRLLNRVEKSTGSQISPRISNGNSPEKFEDLESIFHSTEGLVAVSPCAELAAFFPKRFYFEANTIEEWEQRNRRGACVSSLPVHYANPEDRWKYDVVQSIRTLTLLRQPHPKKRMDGDYHFRTPPELEALFKNHRELFERNQEIIERCSYQISFGKPQFPGYKTSDGSPPAAFLRRLVMEGLRRRYPKNHEQLRPQLEEELAIILEVGYEEYFLVMWEILQDCAKAGIDWITRGSAADSLACYCLGISSVCPIRFDLYFRRFLNKDRMALNKLPDIDVDFPHDRKDDVMDLIFKKHGAAHAAIVGGFSTFQSRSAFAEVAKVLGVSDYQVRRITERLPHLSRPSELAGAVDGILECRDLPLHEEPYRSALHMAGFMDGFPRYPKMHPCGLVLSRQLMEEIVPCFTSAKGYPTTHFDMDSIETVGLIKMDILAQGGLAVMRDVKEMLRNSNPKSSPDFDLDALEPWNDSRVWDLIASGNARAVHHIESPAMVSLCRMCNVRDIDTLIAIVSVIRPGAANENKKMEFTRRYQGLTQPYYPHPSLEQCLRSTFGLVVYEEHILQICEAFAGLPPGRADILRRALGKDREDVIEQIRAEFFECARKLGRDDPKIAEVWDLVTGFKGYAFCKAHSTAYGVEAYQSAWLKLNYPAQFMAAVLTNGKGFYNPLVYILECHRLGIPLLPPSINQPGPHFTVVDNKIRVPALNVKGLTKRTTDAITAERNRTPFASLHDFYLRVHPLNEEMDALIQAGAFDEFGQSRTVQFWEYKGLARNAGPIGSANSRSSNQLWLLQPEKLDRLPAVALSEPDRLQRLRWEEELLGYPVSGHPLELFPDIAWNTYCPISKLGEYIGKQIVTCGLVIEQRMFHQATGEPMKFLTICDYSGIVETELFAKTYKSYGLNTIRYRVLEIAATVEPYENGRGHTLRVLKATKPRTNNPAINHGNGGVTTR